MKPGGNRSSRVWELGLFIAAMLWATGAHVVAGQAAAGIAGRLRLTYGQDLLEGLFLLFLVVIGLRALDFVATKGLHRLEVVALPRRKTSGREWGSGFAIGWALCLAAVLPALLMGKLHAVLNRGVGVIPGVVNATATLAVACLVEEVIFRGYAFRRLVTGLGPGWASAVMSCVFAVALVSMQPQASSGWALWNVFLLGVVLAMCALRTQALWLGWGLHFGYRVFMAAVFGLPIAGRNDFGSLMDSTLGGRRWLSGGVFGLDAAKWTSMALLAAIIVVYRISRDWAWAYTLPEIVAGGYEVVVAPPAAHVAMEKAAAPPPLVQILPSTSQTISVQDAAGPKQ